MNNDKYINNKIIIKLLSINDINQFWIFIDEICEQISVMLISNYIYLLKKVNEINTECIRMECISFQAIKDKRIIRKSNGFINIELSDISDISSYSKVPERIKDILSKNLNLCLTGNIWSFPLVGNGNHNNKACGILLIDLTNLKNMIIIDKLNNFLKIISDLLNDKYIQLIKIDELNNLLLAYKKALLCITHSIQRPLVDINGGITYIKSFTYQNETVKPWVNHIKHTIEDAQIIASSMSKIFRLMLEPNTIFGMESEIINVADEVKSLAKRMRLFEEDDPEGNLKINKKNLKIMYEQKITKINIKADRQTFIFVMYNLLDNAIKYSRKNSTIVIEFGIENDSHLLCLKVKSFGEPIPINEGEENLPFELFWRGEDQQKYKNTGSTFYPGLGVGLWASRVMLEKQGGKIWLLKKTWDDPRLTIFAVRFPFLIY